jgi:dTDP-4-dehydrorhamnose 3,5-epimerase
MIFHETAIHGAQLIEIEALRDERGFFARSFCRDEFARHGLPIDFVQHSLSFNRVAGTLRGMHHQRSPHEEGKLIRCTRGAIHDVIVDLRPASPSHRRWEAFQLTPENGTLLYVPPGCAHGFQTLEDATEVTYQMTVAYVPGFEAGFRWNDERLAIAWPRPVTMISPRDATWPDLL